MHVVKIGKNISARKAERFAPERRVICRLLLIFRAAERNAVLIIHVVSEFRADFSAASLELASRVSRVSAA